MAKSLFFLLFCLCLRSYAQLTPSMIVLRSFNTLDTMRSVHYQAAYKFKFLDSPDTMDFESDAFLYKKNTDTILKGLAWFSISDSEYKFYDLHRIFYVNKRRKEAVTYNPHQGQQFILTGSTSSGVVWSFFLEPQKLKKLCDPANSLQLLPDTSILGNECYQVAIKLPDESELTGKQQVLYITKKDFIPIVYKKSVVFQGNMQYSEFCLKKYSFNNAETSRFSPKQIPATYTITAYKEKPDKESNATRIGIHAPVISGKRYQIPMRPESINFKGKITVLDFWYMSCFPCIKAMPAIEALQKKYDTASVQIFGVNAVDNTPERIKKLPAFMEYNAINYPVLLVDNDIISKFKVEVWPTLYIIGTDGNVVHYQYGFSENLFQELSGIIDKQLKK